MKRHLSWAIASLVLVGAIGGASAADLPVKAPPPAPEIWSWSGFYVGANLGAAVGDETRFTYTMPFTTAGNSFLTCAAFSPTFAPTSGLFGTSTDCSRQTSFLAGLQIGYNWQIANFVLGFEADGQGQSLFQRSFVQFGSNPAAGAPMGSVTGDTAYFSSEMRGLGTFRGRAGWATNWVGGGLLFYGTGGLAVGDVRHTFTEVLDPGTACVIPGTGCRTISENATKWGWTAGAGVEWMLARNASIGFEYLFVDLGSSDLTLAPAGGFFFNTSTARFDDREQIFRVKFNYHFGNYGGPVVAAY
jgi:outer membrane immunogenic protein